MSKSPQSIVYNSKSWSDFQLKLSSLPIGERGIAFEWLCVFYLQIHPVYKANYKRVLHSSEFLKNNKLKKKLGLTHNEQGTDIIGETYDGKIDIIQCKYKDNEQRNITSSDLEPSIRVANGREAKKWVDTILICSNLKGFTKNQVLDELDIQFRTLSRGDFQSLEKKDFDNIRRVIDNKIPKFTRKKPRKHQQKAIKLAKKHFSSDSRGQLIHACGTGKTLTSYFLFKELQPKVTLFVVPSLQLINQTLTEWCLEGLAQGSPISPIVICSDKSNEKISEHDPQLWLHEMGIKVSNNFEELDSFLKSKRQNKVIFSTYQSGKVLSNHFKKLNKIIDFAFFDEAHNTATSRSKLFGHLLDDQTIKIKKRLFMTATPKKLVGKDDRFLSMEDPSVYGEVIDEITVKDAIEDLKLLNDYKIVTQLVDNETSRELVTENPFVIDKKKLPEEVELKLIAAAATLKKTFEEKNIKNAVSFHGRVNRARAFQEGINKIYPEFKLNTYHVNGKQSGTVRSEILADFAINQPSLVTNAQCLSEGVNVPSIDSIIFVDPKQSRVDITQAIGRALRKGDKSKGDSYIIVPIVVDKKDPDSIDEAYQQILMVLRAMSEHDGRIVEYFKLKAEGKKPQKEFIDIETEYLPKDFDLDNFIESLTAKAWSRFARLGRRPFEQAREWARSLELPGQKEWVAFSKTSERPLDIPADPYQSYKREWTSWPDFLGNPTPVEDTTRFIKEYKRYAKGKLDPYPPHRLVLPDGYKLGNKLRAILRSKELNQIPKWREDMIQKELIDKGLFAWTGRDEYIWDKYFEVYKKYLDQGGQKLPKKGTIVDGRNIEVWAHNQKLKNRYRLGEGEATRKVRPLTEEQYKKLKSLNFSFEDVYENSWNEHFEIAKKLLKQHKGKIPETHQKTKSWVTKQRNNYKNHKLHSKQISLLESIPYWSWDPFRDIFEKNMKLLEEFVKSSGNTNLGQKQVYKGKVLGVFLTKARLAYRKGKLDEIYIKRFNRLGVKLEPSRVVGSVRYYD